MKEQRGQGKPQPGRRKPQGAPGGKPGGPRKPGPGAAGGRQKHRVTRLTPEQKDEMQRLMDTECIRKDAALRIAVGEMTFDQFKLRNPAEYAVSFRAKTLMEQNPDMSRARAFWLAEDPKRIEEMRQKQIRTFATYTGLSQEQSRAIATGEASLGQLAREEPRWSFIWERAKNRIKALKDHNRNISPIEAIRWARGDYGLPLEVDENPDEIERIGMELHEKYPFMKKRHTRRMARFGLDLDGLAIVSPANCGWGPRALELWNQFPGHHRKFIRLMAMMNMDDAQASDFIKRTEPSREMYNELAESARPHYFRMYHAEKVARFNPDNNPFAWLLTDEEEQTFKQSKLHVLFFCPSPARGAVFSMAKKDKDIVTQELGAALVANDRLDIEVITETVERAKEKDRGLRVTLRNGMIFSGLVEWDSPFEVRLRLKNDAWMVILYHSIYQIQTAT